MSEYYTDDDVTAALAPIKAQLPYLSDGVALLVAERVLAAVAPAIAARALREAADEVERSWADATHHVMPGVEKVRVNWSTEVSRWLRARAEAVKREAAADKLSQMTQDNDLDDDDWRADGYDDLRGGYYG